MNIGPAAPSRYSFRTLLFSLRSKMVMGFSVLFIVAMIFVVLVMNFGIPFTSYSGSYGNERAQVLNKLSLVGDLTKQRFVHWLGDRKDDARELSEREVVRSFSEKLHQLVMEQTKRGATGDRLKAAVLAEVASRPRTAGLKSLKEACPDCKRIEIADSKTGLVTFSTDEKFLGENVSGRASFTKALQSVAHTSVVPEKDASSGRAYFVFSHAVSSSSLEAAGQDTVLAVGMMYVDIEDVVRPLLYVQNLGETADVVLVDQDRRILLDLRYPLADGTRAKVLEYVVETEPVKMAVQGNEGVVIADDYRGAPVLSVARYIKVTPDQSWALVFKIDRSEVFQPLRQGVIYSFVVGMMGIAAVAAMAVMVAGRISRPIRNLSRVAQEAKAGNLSVRTLVTGPDEIGNLCSVFDSMIERIENWHHELEREVQARTAQLRKVNEDLAAEVAVRKQTELSLAAERERLSVTLRSIGDGVISTDTGGIILSLNWAAEEFTGWKEEEAIGRPLQEVFHIINEQTRRRCEDPVSKVLQTGEIVLLANDTVLIGRDGTERILADSAAPIRDKSGNMLGVVLVFRDVTDRKRSERALRENEARFRSTFEQAAVGIAHVDMDGRYLRVNQKLCDILGYSGEQLMALTVSAITHPDDLPAALEKSEQLLSGQVDTFRMEMREIRADGSTVWINSTVSLHWDEVTDSNYFISVVEDISRRKETEAALQLTLVELERSNAELQQFAYVASHDLQEPLRMISSYVQLLQRRYRERLDADADDFIAFAADGAKRMQRLINDLLQYSRVGTHARPFQPTDCDVVLDQALANLRVSIESSDAKVTRDSLPTVMADRTQLLQVFQNLVDNALKFRGDDPPLIHVSARHNQGHWLFSVRDNGIGIDPQYGERIFVIFQRLHGREEYPGTGIGLAICKKIVERHGGRIWVESDGDNGTTFCFTIP